MLSEIYPGGSPKIGSTYWDQIQEVALVSVAKHLLKRLHECLEQVRSSLINRESIIHSLQVHVEGSRNIF